MKELDTKLNKRIFVIDLLRGVAVLLVLFRHFHNLDYTIKIPILSKIGWIGVDLFFVLSGFLISGLLFNEIKRKGKINFKRFFIRRGFKIYPLFYMLIMLIILLKILTHKELNINNILSELFFLQSYNEGMLVHTWSLGVEEHFYIFLPLLLILFIKLNKSDFGNNKVIQLTFFVIAVFCLSYRIITSNYHHFNVYRSIFNSHIRFDSLFLGVFISYYYNYKLQYLKEWYLKYNYYILLLFFISMIFPLCFDIFDYIIYTFGFSIIALGFGALLLILLLNKDSLYVKKMETNFLFKFLSYIGFYSYSIYLWHIPIEAVIMKTNLYNKIYLYPLFLAYLFVCIIFGAFFSKIVEIPILKIRDKYFP